MVWRNGAGVEEAGRGSHKEHREKKGGRREGKRARKHKKGKMGTKEKAGGG
jgi:hypothetical protein